MNKLINLGAIYELSKQYELPFLSNKINKYICPDCNQKVMLKKGKIKKPHFAHFKSTNKCNYYEHVGESQLHKYAKELMKYVLLNKKCVVIQKCAKCGEQHKFELPKIEKDFNVSIEHSFKYNDKNKIADVCILNKNCIKYICEIYHTHRTMETDRPEPWFEFKALDFIKSVESIDCNEITINCDRDIKCDLCTKFEELDMNKFNRFPTHPDDLEWYIRYKLGQRIFNINTNRTDNGPYYLPGKNINNDSDITFEDIINERHNIIINILKTIQLTDLSQLESYTLINAAIKKNSVCFYFDRRKSILLDQMYDYLHLVHNKKLDADMIYDSSGGYVEAASFDQILKNIRTNYRDSTLHIYINS